MSLRWPYARDDAPGDPTIHAAAYAHWFRSAGIDDHPAAAPDAAESTPDLVLPGTR